MTNEVKKFASDMTDDRGNPKKLPEVLAGAIASKQQSAKQPSSSAPTDSKPPSAPAPKPIDSKQPSAPDLAPTDSKPPIASTPKQPSAPDPAPKPSSASAPEPVDSKPPSATASTSAPAPDEKPKPKSRLKHAAPPKVDDDEEEEDDDYVPEERVSPSVFVEREAAHGTPSSEEEEEEEEGDGDIVDKSWIVDDKDPIEYEDDDDSVPASLAETALARDIASRGFKEEAAAAILNYIVDYGIHEKIRDMVVAELDEKKRKKEGGGDEKKKKGDGPACPLTLDDFLDMAVVDGVLEFFHRAHHSDVHGGEDDSKFNEYAASDQKFSKLLRKSVAKSREIDDAIDRAKRKIRSIPAPAPVPSAASYVCYRDSSSDGSTVRALPKEEGFACDLLGTAIHSYSLKVFSFSGGADLDAIQIVTSREGVKMRLSDAQIIEMQGYTESAGRGYVKCYVTSLAMARIAVLASRVVRIDDMMNAKHFKTPPKLADGETPMDRISAYVAENRASFVSLWEEWKKMYDALESDADRIQRSSL